jgi:hypothetical protein
VRTFVAIALVAMMGVRAAGESQRAGNNPCVDTDNRNPSLLPADDATSNDDFHTYRSRLQMAVERRDMNALLEAADPGIRLGFDGSGGSAALRKMFSDRPSPGIKARLNDVPTRPRRSHERIFAG